MSANNHAVELSNLKKVMFPDIQASKEDVIRYYEKIADHMLPHMKNRPVTMHRFPDGIDKKGFYMKNTPEYFPDWIDTVAVEKKEGGSIEHGMVQSKETLIYLANQACITPHVWLCTQDDLHKPDKMIFDLDPSTDDYESVKQAALALKEIIEGYDLTPFVMTTGSKGLHVVIPITPEYYFDEVREAAVHLSKKVVDRSPDKFTLEQRKEKRGDKVFLDTLRNAYGQTSVTPYALRAIKHAPIATPLTWDELKEHPLDPRNYAMNNIFKRLGHIKDPWESFNRSKRSLEELFKESREK